MSETPLSDAQVESLIEESGGLWREDHFVICGSELSDMLQAASRAALSAAEQRATVAEAMGRDAARYATKRSMDHQRLKTTVAYELANDDARAMMEAAWFMSYDSSIDAAIASVTVDSSERGR